MHTPEFAFEKDQDNVRKAVGELKITYPVALDNDYKIWKAFNNSYWPADYLVDATGHIRFHHFGEGKYDETEQQIQQLLKEHNPQLSVNGLVKVAATGAEAPPDSDVESPETYVGYERADSFMSPGGLKQDARARLLRPQASGAQSMGTLRQLDGSRTGCESRLRARARSCSVSTREMCTWCWGPRPTENRSASG